MAVALREPAVAVVVPQQQVVQAQVPPEPGALVQVQAKVLQAEVLVVRAYLVLEPAAPVERVLSRPSFSVAMAGSTPSIRATYEPVPRSR